MMRAACLLLAAAVYPWSAAADPAFERGRYLFAIAGCAGCHTPKADKAAGVTGAGGRALKSPFGTFFSPNITSDPTTGIGAWTLADFRRALRQGRAPDGSAYFPAFPYTSYTGMTDGDVADLWAFVRTLPAVARPNRPHAVGAPFGWRLSARIWQGLHFSEGATATPDRGAYLVTVLGHCGECHTPRGATGALDPTRALRGSAAGPHGGIMPNITPDAETGIGKWSDGDLKTLFTLGMLPDTDFVGGGMAEVVDRTTSVWTPDDRAAAIRYLRSVPPVHNPVKPKKKKSATQDDWN